MFAIAFDLVVADTLKKHPRGVTQAYADIRDVLTDFGFEWRQVRSALD
jgi:virulence-associated protein VapD